ncbi:MAG: hypothetical protein HOP18_07235 [Deltaproteobacteria bacterium]|nr:hypothetical protein [Deltaproteobacteria bacterium]
MAFSAKEIRAVQQKRAAALATSANETHTEPVSAEAHAARISYLPSWVLIGSVLIVAFSVSYYYMIFLPKAKRMQEALLYSCLSKAEKSYEEEWAAKCKSRADAATEATSSVTSGMKKCLSEMYDNPNRFELCLGLFADVAKEIPTDVDASANCTLPREVASWLNDEVKEVRDMCFKLFPR